jgi:hypothetical protein
VKQWRRTHPSAYFGVVIIFGHVGLFRFAKERYDRLLAFMLPKTKYARSGEVRVAYQISGDGPIDVIWAPGTMSHLDLDWEIPQRALFFERFSKFCRLIRFDKRGTGLSDRPVKMATLEERTDDIRAVMDDVGIRARQYFRRFRGRLDGVSFCRYLPAASEFALGLGRAGTLDCIAGSSLGTDEARTRSNDRYD